MKKTTFARVIISSLFAVVAAGVWDVWWHGALGRESFWSPPHIFLYVAVIVAILTGACAWYRFQERAWKRFVLLLTLIPLSAPIDDFWHRFFGIESISSPAIIWSPPHLLLIFGIIGTLAMILPILRQDEDRDAQRLFGGIAFGIMLILLFLVASPLEPTGPYHLLGFFGAGIFAFFFTSILFIAQRWIPGLGGATLAATFFLVLAMIELSGKIGPNAVIMPHEHPPTWLTVFSVFIPAVLLDFYKGISLWLRGGMVGFVWSFLLFGFASYFFDAPFQYSMSQAFVAVVASVCGGVIAGGMISKIKKLNYI